MIYCCTTLEGSGAASAPPVPGWVTGVRPWPLTHSRLRVPPHPGGLPRGVSLAGEPGLPHSPGPGCQQDELEWAAASQASALPCLLMSPGLLMPGWASHTAHAGGSLRGAAAAYEYWRHGPLRPAQCASH